MRGILEFSYKYPGMYMFYAHTSEFAELGWMGLLQRESLATNECDCPHLFQAFQIARSTERGRPLLLLAGLIWWFFHGGSRLIERPVPRLNKLASGASR